MSIDCSKELFFKIIPNYVKPFILNNEKIYITKKEFTKQSNIPFIPITHCMLYSDKLNVLHIGKDVIFIENLIHSLNLNSWMNEHVAFYLKNNIVLFILILFAANDENHLCMLIEMAIPETIILKNNPNLNHKLISSMAKIYLTETRKQYLSFLFNNDENQSFLSDLILFYKQIMINIETKFSNNYIISMKELGLIPLFYSPTITKRLCLASYFKDSIQIYKTIQMFTTPKITPVRKERKNKNISKVTFNYLCNYLPLVNATITNKFFSFLYKNNFSKHYEQECIENGYTIENINITIPKSIIIFKQLIALNLENWEEIWFANQWFRCKEFNNRLRYISKNIRNYIDIQTITNLFFKPN